MILQEVEAGLKYIAASNENGHSNANCAEMLFDEPAEKVLELAVKLFTLRALALEPSQGKAYMELAHRTAEALACLSGKLGDVKSSDGPDTDE